MANWFTALVFAPLWLLGGKPFAWSHLGHAVLAGTAFFVGQVFTFLALSRGDVSVATPVLGMKVILVALFTVLIVGTGVPARWWWAAGLTAVATALLGGGKKRAEAGSFAHSLAYGLVAAGSFAMTDVLTQKWARFWGFGHFTPVMFGTLAVLSFGLIPFFHGPLRALPASAWRWLLPGCALLAAQAIGVAYSIVTFGDATRVNILYNSRGMWTVVIIWSVGHWFGNEERDQGHAIMGRRLAGAALLLGAIVLAVT